MTRISVRDDGLGHGHGPGEPLSDKYLHATRRVPASGSLLGNAKYRFREDRKKVLKLSVRKLRDIDDPEAFLCR